MAKEEIFFGINIDTGDVIKDFGTLKKRTKELKKELDGTKVGTKRFEELRSEITKNQATIRRFNRELRETKSLATRVGQGVTTAFKRVGGALAGAFAIGGVFQAFKGAVGVIIDFEQAIRDVGAVSGATDEELKGLEKSARELAKVSVFTAEQVAGLQLELAKLGFTSKEIQQSSSGIINLSTAFRIDLAQAATVSASTLRAFGLDASEMTRVTDVMADSFASSALDIEKFQESMKLVAPSAKSTGRTLEETTALLSVLANNGISGSIAGTQLRRVFIELNKQGLTLEEAMDKVANSTDKLGKATDLVGVRGATALQIFADQSDSLEKLREDYSDTANTAQELADKSGDTLQGALKRLRSAYEELILKFSGSKGTLRDIIESISDFINSIDEDDVKTFTNAVKNLFKVIAIGVKTWVAYKATIIATNLATKLYTASTVTARIASIAFSGGLKNVTRAMKLLNLTIKSNPIGLLVGGITTLISVMSLWGDEEEEVEKRVKRTNKALIERKTIVDELTNVTPELKKAFEELEEELDLLSDPTEAQSERLRELKEAAMDAFLGSAEAYREGLGSLDLFSLQTDAKDLTDRIKDLEEQVSVFDAGEEKDNAIGFLKVLKGLLRDVNNEISSRTGEEDDSLGLIADLEEKLKNLGKNLKKAKTVDEIMAIGEEIKNVNKQLAFYKELSKGISDAEGFNEDEDPFFNTFVDDTKDINEDPDIEFARLKRAELLKQAGETTDGLIREEERLTEAKMREAQVRNEITGFLINQTQDLIGSTIAFLQRDEDARKANAEKIKAWAKAKVLVDLASQIQNIWTTNSSITQPGNAFTFGATGTTASIIQTGIATANALAQVATIQSQKFAKGGILNGPSHAQGGIKTPFGELEGGEAVINKKSTKKYGGILSAINEAGGGKKFARGGILPNPSTISTPNSLNSDILKAINSIDMKPTVSVVEINEAQTRISEIENNSTL
jgi:hypothetical protein